MDINKLQFTIPIIQQSFYLFITSLKIEILINYNKTDD